MLKSNSTVPLLIIQGAKDKLVPQKNAPQIFDAAKCSKKLVIDPSTHHGDYKLAFLSTTIRSFLDGLK
jgi:pimeloyl-ACP methyl ester carboxylesterase